MDFKTANFSFLKSSLLALWLRTCKKLLPSHWSSELLEISCSSLMVFTLDLPCLSSCMLGEQIHLGPHSPKLLQEIYPAYFKYMLSFRFGIDNRSYPPIKWERKINKKIPLILINLSKIILPLFPNNCKLWQ